MYIYYTHTHTHTHSYTHTRTYISGMVTRISVLRSSRDSNYKCLGLVSISPVVTNVSSRSRLGLHI